MRSEWPECSNLHFIPNRGSFLGMESAARARGSAWVGTWKGGRIQRLKDGRNRYVLRRMVGGVRYSLTLAARDEEEALGAFYAFRQAPLRFIADHKSVKVAKKRAGVKHGLRLDQALITALDRWLQQEGRSAKHRKNTRSYLTWWGRIPRVLDLDGDGLDRALGKLPGRKHRIIAFKTLGKFLTTTSSDDRPRLRPEENPARFLRVPKAKGGKKKGYSRSTLERIYARIEPDQKVDHKGDATLAQLARDVFRLQVHLGMHYTEVARLAARAGTVEQVDHPVIKGVVAFPHKGGFEHRVSLDARGYAAAMRLYTAGRLPSETRYRALLAQASRWLGTTAAVVPGRLRHSLVTLGQSGTLVWKEGQGVTLDVIAQITGHQGTATTRKHYNSLQVPPLPVIPLTLQHRADPA